MKIVVPIKQVPETGAVRMDERTGTMLREGVEAIVNPLDLYAIELALVLREAHGGEVVAVSMGPPKAESALREAVAMGCDRGVLLSDRLFAGADTWATSRTLSLALQRLAPFDLVLCGERATDGDTGQVGPALAACLDLPVVTYVSQLEALQGGTARVHRLVEDGYEVLDVDLPAVLTVVKEVGHPRLPTLRGKQRARLATVPVWSAADLGTTADSTGLAGSPTRVVRIHKPSLARQGTRVAAPDEAAAGRAVDSLLAFLDSKGMLE